MPTVCSNCDSVVADYTPCPCCEYAHRQLLERLTESDDGAVEWWVLAVEAGGWGDGERRYEWRVG